MADGGGISAGSVIIDARVVLDQASLRQTVNEAQSKITGMAGGADARGARVSPGANAASDPHVSGLAARARQIEREVAAERGGGAPVSPGAAVATPGGGGGGGGRPPGQPPPLPARGGGGNQPVPPMQPPAPTPGGARPTSSSSGTGFNMSNGLFMSALFGGWEVHQASAASAHAQSVNRANPNSMASAIAQQQSIRQITSGPLGSILGTAFQSSINQLDASIASSRLTEERTEAMRSRGQFAAEATIRGRMAGGSGPAQRLAGLELDASRQGFDLDTRRKSELDLELRARGAEAESNRANATDKMNRGFRGLMMRMAGSTIGSFIPGVDVIGATGKHAYDTTMKGVGAAADINNQYKEIQKLQLLEQKNGLLGLRDSLLNAQVGTSTGFNPSLTDLSGKSSQRSDVKQIETTLKRIEELLREIAKKEGGMAP
jgi:hypothetical protein